METFQHIMVYLALALALFFLGRKYLFPAKWKKASKSPTHDCDSGDCGCH